MSATSSATRWNRATGLLLALGMVLQFWLWLRGWLSADQVKLLKLGFSLALEGELSPHGSVLSDNAVVPGSLLQLVIGVPLALWFDYRSPALLIGLSHLAAIAVLLVTFRGGEWARFRTLLVAVYWLSPWRLFHSAFLWEPNYLLLPAALHLSAAFALRSSRLFLPSAVLGGVVLLAPQLHPSGIVLLLATLLLWLTGRLRIHGPGLVSGALLGAITLAPALRAALTGGVPSPVPEGGLAGWGIVKVYPMLRVIQYWLRLGSADIGRRLRQVELEEALGAGWSGALVTGLSALCAVSLIVVVVANLAAIRRLMARGTDSRTFLICYAAAVLLAELVGVAVSPVTPQGWHLIVGLHAACLPVVVWIEEQISRPASRVRRRWLVAIGLFLALRLPVDVMLGAHPQYRIPHDPEQVRRASPEYLQWVEPGPAPYVLGTSAPPGE